MSEQSLGLQSLNKVLKQSLKNGFKKVLQQSLKICFKSVTTESEKMVLKECPNKV